MNLIEINILQTPTPDPLSITAIIVAIASAIWSVISYIIRKNIDKKYEENLEKVKTGNQKEIEQYKVNLTEQIEKQKAEFLKEIEDLKAKNENKTYITKTQFDTEFKIYQELSEACYDMVIDMLDLFTNKPELVEKQKDPVHNSKICARSKKSNYHLQHILSKYSAFISKEMYELYSDLRIRCKKQTDAFYEIYIKQQEPSLSIDEYIKKSSELFNIYFVITEKLRVYLKSLKVIED